MFSFSFFSDFCLCVLCTCCLFVGRTKLTALATVDVQRRNCSPSPEFGGQRSEVFCGAEDKSTRQYSFQRLDTAACFGFSCCTGSAQRQVVFQWRLRTAERSADSWRTFARAIPIVSGRSRPAAAAERATTFISGALGGGCIYDDDDTMYSCSRRSPVSKFSDVISRPRQRRDATIQGPRHFLRPGPVPSDLK